ncbi:hypothetical protein F4553_001428 [Allocatelliglobosispora scoriae]|uniref:Uncharacterized protein n=1 Tax=Allocatelliglobosispora scoriae TaxID=643052 RepID=A0A841BLH3_9ACTN|nr:hypothetical protein [Allocatelliglobosispora scoriae]
MDEPSAPRLDSVRELERGMIIWQRRKWPPDFHNGHYAALAEMCSRSMFTPS